MKIMAFPCKNFIFLFQVCVFMTICWATLMYTWREIMCLWRLKLTRTQIKCFYNFHMYVSYPKTSTKIEIYSECILPFCTLNDHILLTKRDSEMRRYLGKILFKARVSAPDAKIGMRVLYYHSNGILKDFNFLWKIHPQSFPPWYLKVRRDLQKQSKINVSGFWGAETHIQKNVGQL